MDLLQRLNNLAALGYDAEELAQAAAFFEDLSRIEVEQFLTNVADMLPVQQNVRRFESFKFAPASYVETFLGWAPWQAQHSSNPRYGQTGIGQAEVFAVYRHILVQQQARLAYEAGQPYDATIWQPDTPIKNWISVDSGHNIGKTKLLAGVVSHFFDCFRPSIIYCFAPLHSQINDLLFKELRIDRGNKNLTGRVMHGQTVIKHRANHFVSGKATLRSSKNYTELVQGQHEANLMFVLDEAEGISDYVFSAVESMASGFDYCVVVIARNPRTTSCAAHQLRSWRQTQPLRVSCFDHPNVIENHNVIPGGVRRDYIESMLRFCEVVEKHDSDQHTFELFWRPGVIYRPKSQFLWRVLGIADERISDRTLVSISAFQQMKDRSEEAVFKPSGPMLRIGVDSARYGDDLGKVYQWRGQWVWLSGEFQYDDSHAYYKHLKEEIRLAVKDGVTNVQIRVDSGGGFSSGFTDMLNHDFELMHRFDDPGSDFYTLETLDIIEVAFNETPFDTQAYYNRVTELYARAGEAVEWLYVSKPTTELEVDLTQREFMWGFYRGGDVRRLQSKDEFKALYGRSPDDGDGFVLAVAPDEIFNRMVSGNPFI